MQFGWVYKAHSKTKCDGSLPISLIKYQYFLAEAASVILFPINYEYNLDAVSNPIVDSICEDLIFPSIVAGTLILLKFYKKFKI